MFVHLHCFFNFIFYCFILLIAAGQYCKRHYCSCDCVTVSAVSCCLLYQYLQCNRRNCATYLVKTIVQYRMNGGKMKLRRQSALLLSLLNPNMNHIDSKVDCVRKLILLVWISKWITFFTTTVWNCVVVGLPVGVSADVVGGGAAGGSWLGDGVSAVASRRRRGGYAD